MMKRTHLKLALYVATVMAFGAVAATGTGQTSPSLATATPQVATTGEKPILFEVVSIRPYKANISYGPGFTDDGYIVHGVSPQALLWGMCACKRIEGMPDWAMHEVYGIEAKVADADVARWKTMDFKQKDLAVQALLEDRFKLKFHHETRVMPGYALVVAKNGPKFKESIPGDLYPGGPKGLDGGPWMGLVQTSRDVMTAQHTSMEELADFLTMAAGRPVTDQTGLKGFYDFKIKMETPEPSTTTDTTTADSGPSIFTMIQEQLGLKLESGAKVPVEYLVIDHIERPTEN